MDDDHSQRYETASRQVQQHIDQAVLAQIHRIDDLVVANPMFLSLGRDHYAVYKEQLNAIYDPVFDKDTFGYQSNFTRRRILAMNRWKQIRAVNPQVAKQQMMINQTAFDKVILDGLSETERQILRDKYLKPQRAATMEEFLAEDNSLIQIVRARGSGKPIANIPTIRLEMLFVENIAKLSCVDALNEANDKGFTVGERSHAVLRALKPPKIIPDNQKAALALYPNFTALMCVGVGLFGPVIYADKMGMSLGTIQRWATGIAQPPMTTRERLVQVTLGFLNEGRDSDIMPCRDFAHQLLADAPAKPS